MSFLQELYKYIGNEANRTSNAPIPSNHKKNQHYMQLERTPLY